MAKQKTPLSEDSAARDKARAKKQLAAQTASVTKKRKHLSLLKKAAVIAALPVLPLALPIIESFYNPVEAGKAAGKVLAEPYNPKAWVELAKYKARAVKKDVKLAKKVRQSW